jgi:prophage regulatory protein
MYKLPETGFLRLSDVIGEEEVTEDQAAANREYNKQAEADAFENGRVDKQGKPIYARRPTTARPSTPAIIPVKKSCWWDGVRTGRFPKPVKLGRCTMWRVEEIRTLIASA